MNIPAAFRASTKSLKETLTPKPTQVTRSYVNWTKFLEGGYHTLLHGRTGAGKTTLLLTLLKVLYRNGHRVLMRDDGGLEFLHLLHEIPMIIWIPAGCSLEIDTDLNHEVRRFSDHKEILDNVYTGHRFQVIVYDAYCVDPSPAARFYSDLFKELIYRCMQTSRSEKEPLVFSFDELNDLIQPQGRGLTKEHSRVKHILEYNVRKLRKHRVTLIASTHRFNQIGINVRSQFSYILIKQSYGSDVYDFINKNLVTAADNQFWSILRDLTSMDPWYVYVFDYKNNFDKLVFPDIQRSGITYRLDGEIQGTQNSKMFDEKDIYILYARTKDPPMSYRSIAEHLDIAHSTVSARHKKLQKISHLNRDT
jgi:hypothetical protein